MSFFLTCVYVIMLLLRPHEWLVPGLAAFRPMNLIAIMALGSCAGEKPGYKRIVRIAAINKMQVFFFIASFFFIRLTEKKFL